MRGRLRPVAVAVPVQESDGYREQVMTSPRRTCVDINGPCPSCHRGTAQWKHGERSYLAAGDGPGHWEWPCGTWYRHDANDGLTEQSQRCRDYCEGYSAGVAAMQERLTA